MNFYDGIDLTKKNHCKTYADLTKEANLDLEVTGVKDTKYWERETLM